ncbi:hypothetical protein L6452_27201 [Arctium lappa]|uniref:Uncharacterized protein n=1 Tax=Arctium lappa TaxID=4217 RepID=A0ACB8ZW99_ARCLA|nr:hypothetical protein L6452_27201 [Arctium lappa]
MMVSGMGVEVGDGVVVTTIVVAWWSGGEGGLWGAGCRWVGETIVVAWWLVVGWSYSGVRVGGLENVNVVFGDGEWREAGGFQRKRERGVAAQRW